MKRYLCEIFLIIVMGCSMAGCGMLKKTPKPTNTTVYTYKDSVIINDSIRVVDLPVEKIIDLVPVYDTLEMETSLAKSRAWVDTSKHLLRGSIMNKPQAKLKTENKEKIVYRDSISTKEVPVPYEVVKIETKYPTLFWVLLAIVGLIGGIYIVKLARWLMKIGKSA